MLDKDEYINTSKYSCIFYTVGTRLEHLCKINIMSLNLVVSNSMFYSIFISMIQLLSNCGLCLCDRSLLFRNVQYNNIINITQVCKYNPKKQRSSYRHTIFII